MGTEPEIATIIAEFHSALADYEKANAELDERKLDVRIAERAGTAVKAAKEAEHEFLMKQWAPAYDRRKASARALCQTLGIKPGDLKAVL